jgi:hypothetical protein
MYTMEKMSVNHYFISNDFSLNTSKHHQNSQGFITVCTNYNYRRNWHIKIYFILIKTDSQNYEPERVQ